MAKSPATRFHKTKNEAMRESDAYCNGKLYYRSGLPSENAMKEKEEIRNDLITGKIRG